ncbi:hypothetical protein [Arthrobacter sp. HLT1-20]
MSHQVSTMPGLGGGAARAGPAAAAAAEAVVVVAQRLAGIAEELEGLRLQLGRFNGMDWRSPAAAAFRDRLTECNLALAAVARDISDAVAALGSHALSLQSLPALPGDGLGLGVHSSGVPDFGVPDFGAPGLGMEWPLGPGR